MLPPGEATEHTATLSASSETQADSDLFDGAYIRKVKLVRGIPVVTTILRPCTGASSSSSSTLSSDQGSSKDYPEIRVSTCGSSADISRLIFMVAPNEYQPRHSSSGYPTIGRSEVSDARTPSTRLIQNLNLDFNDVRVQAIMETIQRMAPDGSPLLFWHNRGLKQRICRVEKVRGLRSAVPYSAKNRLFTRVAPRTKSKGLPIDGLLLSKKIYFLHA
jgi:hypothetical protein